MLAQVARRLPKGRQWAYEFKWDGIRAITHVNDGELRIIGRNGRDLTARFPELHGLATMDGGKSMTLDGEIVVIHNDRTDFGRLQPRMHLTQADRITRLSRSDPAMYMIFDLLEQDGTDLTAQPLHARRKRLEQLDLTGPHWALPPLVPGGGDAAEMVVSVARQHELEGVIAKRWDSEYEPGQRSGAWVKYKIINTQEFVVGGWRASQSGRNEVGALAVGYHPSIGDPTLRFAGFVGTGFKQDDHRQLIELLRARQRSSSPFDEPLPKRDVRFVRPDLVVHVGFAEWTAQGILRHASYRGLRDDKPANEVTRER